jgi:peptidoglycan/LPS O-acetylase OafA/YrhL
MVLEVSAPLWSPYFIFSGGMAVMTQSIGHLIIFPQAKPFTTFFLPVSYLSGYSSYFLLFFFFRKAMAKTFNFEEFYVSRIMRIYPPVAFSIIMIYASSYLISPNHSYQINDLIQSLPSLFNYPMTRINDIPLVIMNSGVLWTMVWELRLYVAIPIIFILLKDSLTPNLLC